MTESTLDATVRAEKLLAIQKKMGQPPTAMPVAMTRSHLGIVLRAAAAVAIAITIAIFTFLPRHRDDVVLRTASQIKETSLPMTIPQPPAGAMSAVADQTAKTKTTRRPTDKQSYKKNDSQMTEHDRLLAEIVAAETPETQMPELPVDDPRRYVAAIINSEIAINSDRYTGYPIISPSIYPNYDK